MQQTKKLLNLESKRSAIEDQLTRKEHQFDEMYSRTMRSEIVATNTEGPNSRENSKNSKPRPSSLPPKSDKKNLLHKDEKLLTELSLAFKDTLVILKNHFALEIPPVDNLEDPRWTDYGQRLKSKVKENKSLLLNSQEEAMSYKKLLEEKTLEYLDLHTKYKQMEEHVQKWRSLSKSESFDMVDKIADFMNDVRFFFGSGVMVRGCPVGRTLIWI